MATQLAVLNAELLDLAQLLQIGHQLWDDLGLVDETNHVEEIENGQTMHLLILISYLK